MQKVNFSNWLIHEKSSEIFNNVVGMSVGVVWYITATDTICFQSERCTRSWLSRLALARNADNVHQVQTTPPRPKYQPKAIRSISRIL